MKYTKHSSNGLISCDNLKCPEWHFEGHSTDDLCPSDYMVSDKGYICCLGCGEELADPIFDHSKCQKQLALRMVERYGMIDGAHHKQWVIDQMVRATLGMREYRRWVEKMNADPEYEPWNVGIAP